MPKFMLRAEYTAEALQGYMRDGFATRRAVASELAAHVGGSVDCSYFTAGGHELWLIVDMPNELALNAMMLSGNSSGAARVAAFRLYTLEEMDQATVDAPTYHAPGDR